MRIRAEVALLDQAAEHARGVFTWHDARTAGVPDEVIRRRLATGAWSYLQPRTMRAAGTPVTWATRAMAAVKAVTDPEQNDRQRVAAVSHHSAAKMLGLRRAARDEPLQITVTGRALPELWDVTVHRTTRLDACDVRAVDLVPCTTGARTAIDLAMGVDRIEALTIVDDIVGGGIDHIRWIHRRLATLHNGRRNAAYLYEMTAEGAPGVFRSWLERHSDGVFDRGGLPPREWNVRIKLRNGRTAVADAYWTPWKVIVELDGPSFHDTPERRAKDYVRDRQLTVGGHLVLRFTYWEIVQQPEQVVGEIAAALKARGFVG
jgi:hypothetical protein